MVRVGDYESAPDPDAARWIAVGLRGFARSVLSVVPVGFESYGRVFHPAWSWDGEQHRPVRWRDVAQANGRVAHRAMQWPSITGSFRFEHGASQPGIWDSEPEEGSLPQELLPALVSVLARHTSTPERCWFAIWEGYGCVADDAAPAFDIPHRRQLLFTGPITAVRTSLCSAPSWQSPSLWWPQDRAWCVETEVDFMSTYIGGTRKCITELVAHEDLEAMTVEPSDGITYDSDQVNPPPSTHRRTGSLDP